MAIPSERPFLRPYLMVSGIPYYVDAAGDVWVDHLWHLDLMRHLPYLPRFTLIAPRRRRNGEPNLVRVDPERATAVHWVNTGSMDSWGSALRNLPHLLWILWREIGKNDVVQYCVAGWPFPISWVADPIARLRGRKTVVVVESSPWRLARNRSRSLKARIRERVYESIAKRIVTRADIALFTQPEYRESLFRGGKGRAEVTPATWIGEADLLDPWIAAELWRRKRAERPVRVLFAGRLVLEKGVGVLLRAMSILECQGPEIQLDIIGSGDLRDSCEEMARRQSTARIRLIEPVAYGPEFFRLVRAYHVLIVTNLLDEQARVLFDAMSQAVSIIATDTPGNRPHVIEGATGWLVAPGDADALARALARATREVEALERMGLAAREAVQGKTHGAMHANRREILHDVFD